MSVQLNMLAVGNEDSIAVVREANRIFSFIALYATRLLKNSETTNFKQLTITVPIAQKLHQEEFRAFEQELFCTASFDWDGWLAASEAEKLLLALGLWQRCLQALASWGDYAVADCLAALESIRESNFNNHYWLGKSKAAPGKRLVAALHVLAKLDFYEVSVMVYDKAGNLLAQHPLIHSLPHPYFAYRLVKLLRWVDAETLEISDASGGIVFWLSAPNFVPALALRPSPKQVLPALISELLSVAYGVHAPDTQAGTMRDANLSEAVQ